MTTSEKIKLYRKFDEGTEITDAVTALLNAAGTLNGLSADHELALTMLVVEKLITDYLEYARLRNLSWEDYNRIDPELYSWLLGGAQKLSEEQYETKHWAG